MDHDDTLHIDGVSESGSPAAPDMTGVVIDGRYEIRSLLGEGGMGHVYRARHILMNKDVAIKVIHAELAHVDEIAKRFEREARSSSRLSHPNCISVTDFGRTADNQLFLVMELLEGEELDRKLEREGKLEPAEAIAICAQILKGLAHAHDQGVVHRDLKPENIFLVDTEDGEPLVKILDFGIAKMTTEKASEKLTRTGMIFGTPKYLSPEQALGDKVDHRADLYAVGIILFEMLTGRPPYEGETAMDTMSLHLTAPPPKLSDYGAYPRGLQQIINKAMAKKPKERFKNAAAFLDALMQVNVKDVTTGLSIADILPAAPLRRWDSVPKRWKRPSLRWLVVGAVLALAVASAVWFLRDEEPQQATHRPAVHRPARPTPAKPEPPAEPPQVVAAVKQAESLLAQGQAAAAVTWARKALAQDADNARAKAVLGHALFAQERRIGGVFQYRAALEKEPELFEADPRIRKNLEEALRWDDVRARAADTLARFGGDAGVAQLAALSNSALTTGDVRRAAREALVATGHEDAVDWVASLTADFLELKTCKERIALISGIVERKDPRFLPFLQELRAKTRSPKRAVRRQYACLRTTVAVAIGVLEKHAGQDR